MTGRLKRQAEGTVHWSRTIQPTSGAGTVTADPKKVAGGPSTDSNASSCAKIELKLLDANDNNPVFLPSNQYKFSIEEDAQEGDIIGKVRLCCVVDGCYRVPVAVQKQQDRYLLAFLVQTGLKVHVYP